MLETVFKVTFVEMLSVGEVWNRRTYRSLSGALRVEL